MQIISDKNFKVENFSKFYHNYVRTLTNYSYIAVTYIALKVYKISILDPNMHIDDPWHVICNSVHIYA